MAVQIQTGSSRADQDQGKVIRLDTAVKGISPQVTAAIRRDVITLSTRMAAQEIALKAVSLDLPEIEAETASGHQAVLREAVDYDWSAYMELVMGNLQTQAAQPLSQTVRIDWDILLNWAPSPGKTLEENMQDLAVRYQELWRAISGNFSGMQQMALLSKLDMLMMTKLELLFRMDMMRLYDFLTVNGQREAAEAIRPSVQRAGFAMARGTSVGGGTLGGNAPGTQSPQAFGRTAAALGEKGGGPRPAGSSAYNAQGSGGTRAQAVNPAMDTARFSRAQTPAGTVLSFGLRELRQAGRFAESLASPNYGLLQDAELKETLAFVDAGLVSLKADVFFRYADLSPGLADTMQKAMKQFLSAYQEAEPSHGREGGAAGFHAAEKVPAESNPNFTRKARGAEARPSAVLVAEKMSEAFARSGNVREAVMEGLRYARTLQGRAEQPQHENEQLFWKAALFGTADPGEPGRKPPLQLIRENWNSFLKGLDLRREKNAELYFGAYESGGLQMPARKGESGGNARGAITTAALMAFLLIPPAAALLAGKPVMAGGLLLLGFCAAVALRKAGR